SWVCNPMYPALSASTSATLTPRDNEGSITTSWKCYRKSQPRSSIGPLKRRRARHAASPSVQLQAYRRKILLPLALLAAALLAGRLLRRRLLASGLLRRLRLLGRGGLRRLLALAAADLTLLAGDVAVTVEVVEVLAVVHLDASRSNLRGLALRLAGLLARGRPHVA